MASNTSNLQELLDEIEVDNIGYDPDFTMGSDSSDEESPPSSPFPDLLEVDRSVAGVPLPVVAEHTNEDMLNTYADDNFSRCETCMLLNEELSPLQVGECKPVKKCHHMDKFSTDDGVQTAGADAMQLEHVGDEMTLEDCWESLVDLAEDGKNVI